MLETEVFKFNLNFFVSHKLGCTFVETCTVYVK